MVEADEGKRESRKMTGACGRKDKESRGEEKKER